MRQTISGLVAAVAVVAASAVPAMACGGGGLFQSSCSPCGQTYSPCEQAQVYVAPTPAYSGCDSGCGGWAKERLPDPVQQYYYADQGPAYSGPGNFAPLPTYQESAVSGWSAYRHHPYHYGYDGGRYANATNHYYDGAGIEGPAVYSYRSHPHFRPWRAHTGYYHAPRMSYRYGYAPHHYAPHYSLPPHQFYAPHHSLRYGAPMGMPHRYGYREHVLRRYN
jgi:hypothetical protein